MAKIIIVALALAGFYGASKAFFPVVWEPTEYQIPFTATFFSWGMALMGVVVFLGMKLKAK